MFICLKTYRYSKLFCSFNYIMHTKFQVNLGTGSKLKTVRSKQKIMN